MATELPPSILCTYVAGQEPASSAAQAAVEEPKARGKTSPLSALVGSVAERESWAQLGTPYLPQEGNGSDPRPRSLLISPRRKHKFPTSQRDGAA